MWWIPEKIDHTFCTKSLVGKSCLGIFKNRYTLRSLHRRGEASNIYQSRNNQPRLLSGRCREVLKEKLEEDAVPYETREVGENGRKRAFVAPVSSLNVGRRTPLHVQTRLVKDGENRESQVDWFEQDQFPHMWVKEMVSDLANNGHCLRKSHLIAIGLLPSLNGRFEHSVRRRGLWVTDSL